MLENKLIKRLNTKDRERAGNEGYSHTYHNDLTSHLSACLNFLVGHWELGTPNYLVIYDSGSRGNFFKAIEFRQVVSYKKHHENVVPNE